MRHATVKRETAETKIRISFNLDGKGKSDVKSSIPFLDHMLTLFAKHSYCDLVVRASGDIEVDQHHLVEDIGIVLGDAIKKALGKKTGIARYGNFLMPMDEALSYVAIDLSGRPYLSFMVKFRRDYARGVAGFDYSLVKEFFKALVSSAGMTLHIKTNSGETNHHIAESVFKGFAKAFYQACRRLPHHEGCRTVPSTKKIL